MFFRNWPFIKKKKKEKNFKREINFCQMKFNLKISHILLFRMIVDNKINLKYIFPLLQILILSKYLLHL